MPLPVTVAPELTPNTVLYRTTDFFSAASTITDRKLMFSRADTFADKNEGIDRLLKQLEASVTGAGCGGMGWTDARTARYEHERVKRSHYISCWSTNAESVAMWSLYSPDFCSVRLSTTLAKLLPVVEVLADKYSISRMTSGDIGSQVVVATDARIEPIKYSSLSNLSARIDRRINARKRLEDRYQRHGRTVPALSEVDPRYWQREDQRRIRELRTTCRLKDSSFAHEQEVRLTVRLGEEFCTEKMLEEQAWIDTDHQYHSLLKENLSLWRWINTNSTPEREYVTCHMNLVETVALDPRCPPHKASFMRAWFHDRGIRVVNSTCFGYLPDSFKNYPER